MAKLQTFYYHDTGSDSNGNNGPEPTDPGWIAVTGKDDNEALTRLPARAQKKIKRFMEELQKEHGNSRGGYDYTKLGDCMAATCGWGCNFSFLNDADWEALCDEYADEV